MYVPRKKMESMCPASCNFCPLTGDDPCLRVNKTAVASGPGAIGKAFRRMRESFSEFEPASLSSDPPVLKYNNFLSASESRRLITLCEPRLTASTVGVNE